jgi:hypothetical protein
MPSFLLRNLIAPETTHTTTTRTKHTTRPATTRFQKQKPENTLVPISSYVTYKQIPNNMNQEKSNTREEDAEQKNQQQNSAVEDRNEENRANGDDDGKKRKERSRV